MSFKYIVFWLYYGITVRLYGPYGVMVSTEVCGTSSSGSNPDKDPKIMKEMRSIL